MNDQSIYNHRFGDTYFSLDGGLGEKRHVFLQGNDLPARWQGRRLFTICELGFGTGLNFIGTWRLFNQTAHNDQELHYIAVEGYPLSTGGIREALQLWAGELDCYFERLCVLWPPHVPGWHRIAIDTGIYLTLIFEDVHAALEQLEVPSGVDCWYPDGFNPANNREMWSQDVFDAMARLSAWQASFATYTAAGFVRRGLEVAGFDVEKRPGFGKKRHMLAGKRKEM